MSDPKAIPEVEDVLLSIRRLVASETRTADRARSSRPEPPVAQNVEPVTPPVAESEHAVAADEPVADMAADDHGVPPSAAATEIVEPESPAEAQGDMATGDEPPVAAEPAAETDASITGPG